MEWKADQKLKWSCNKQNCFVVCLHIKILQLLGLGKFNFLETNSELKLKNVWKMSTTRFLKPYICCFLYALTSLHRGCMGLAKFIFLCLTSGESMIYDHKLNTQKYNNNSYICFLTCCRPTFKKPVYFLYRSIFDSSFLFDDIFKVPLRLTWHLDWNIVSLSLSHTRSVYCAWARELLSLQLKAKVKRKKNINLKN